MHYVQFSGKGSLLTTAVDFLSLYFVVYLFWSQHIGTLYCANLYNKHALSVLSN